MRHNSHTGVADRLDDIQISARCLDFYHLSAAFGSESSGVFDRLGNTELIRQKGHIRDKADIGRSPADGGGNRDHKIHSRGQGGIVAQDNLGGGIAHKNHLDVGLGNKPGRGVVIATDGHDLAALLFGIE